MQTEQVVEAQPAFKALETGSAGPAVKAEQVVEAQPAFKAVETGSVGPAVKAEQVVEAQPAFKAVETGSVGSAVKAEQVVENKDTRIAEAKEALAKYAEKVRNSTNWVPAEQVVEAQPAFKALETGSAGPAVKSEVVQAMVLRKMLGR